VTSVLGYKDFAPQAGPTTKRLQQLLQNLIYQE